MHGRSRSIESQRGVPQLTQRPDSTTERENGPSARQVAERRWHIGREQRTDARDDVTRGSTSRDQQVHWLDRSVQPRDTWVHITAPPVSTAVHDGNTAWPARTAVVAFGAMSPNELTQRRGRPAHPRGSSGQMIDRPGNARGTTAKAVGRPGRAIGPLGKVMWRAGPTVRSVRLTSRTDRPFPRTVGESHLTTGPMSSAVAGISADQRGVACDHETVKVFGVMDARAESIDHSRPTTQFRRTV